MSQDKLAGRLTGSAGEAIAIQYAVNYFKQLGLQPAGDKGTYLQRFPCHSCKPNGHSHNVLARLKTGKLNSAVIIIGAHIDHLGHGLNKKNIYPGADDNASGVASVLAAASKLAQLKLQNKLPGKQDVLFALWSGEEVGLLGSTHFIKQINKERKINSRPINAYINLDMVGRFTETLVLQGVGSSANWQSIIKNTTHRQPLSIILQSDPYLPTDSTAFYLQDVPTLNFFTGSHKDYHTTRDTSGLLNYFGMKQIADFLVELVLTIEKNNKLLSFQAVKKTNRPSRGYKIYLGTIPDYTSDLNDGLKLAGVIKGSPADHAHLKRGDVVHALSGKKVHDIYDYTFALNALHAGAPASVLISRGGKALNLQVVPMSRETQLVPK